MVAPANSTSPAADRAKYEHEIEVRELRIEDTEAEIEELEERLADARAAAIVGDGPSSLVNELQAKIDKANTFVRETLAEVKALRDRMEAVTARESAEDKQRTVDAVVLPAVLEMASAAHAVDELACKLGRAIASMVEASVRAGNAFPFQSSNVLTRFIDRNTLASFVWAKICAHTGGAIPFAPPRVGGDHPAAFLNVAGRDVLGGPVTWDEPLLPRHFVAMWHAFIRDEAGRLDAASEVLARIESPPAKKRAKEAA